MQTKKAFFKEALKNIKTAGTIVPSSRFLVHKLIKNIDFDNAKVIVEFGPGNGIITKQLLKKMNANCRLICFEINEEFYKHLQLIDDEKFILLKKSAEDVIIELNKLNIKQVDTLISSLPLSIIPKEIVTNILTNSKKILKNKGVFMQFQYTTTFYNKIKEVFFPENVSLKFEARNFPPAFIYTCIKK